MRSRDTIAKLVFIAGAVLGILSAGAGALWGAAYASGNIWASFFAIWVPVCALWALFCYGSWRGVESDNALLKIVFWMFVLFHVFIFPMGTAIAAASIWLWREVRKTGSLSAAG